MKVQFNLIILLILFNLEQFLNSIIGIDMGTQYFKVVIVKTNDPFQIVENIQTKRKTETSISFRLDERSYGPDAISKRARNPNQTFSNLQEFLGKSKEDDELRNIIESYFISNEISEDQDRGTVKFSVKFIGKDMEFSVEELSGMLFRYIKFLSEKYSKGSVRECVVTVPAFYGYKERLAVQQSVELSGLTLLGIINENVGAAVHYGLERKITKTEKIVIFNMGNSFTQATLYEITPVESFNEATNKNNTFIQINVLSEVWEKNLGGRNLHYNLIKYLIGVFNEYPQIKNKISLSSKYAEKILQEAIKAKEILSANKEVIVQVLGLEDNTNLKEKVSREKFEEINRKDLEKSYDLIERVLIEANATIDDIDQVELIGGAVRVPFIQNLLKEKIGNKLGAHMNGDESIAFGTAFVAANFSSFIRTKQFNVDQGVNYEITAKIKNVEKSSSKGDCQHFIDENSNDNYTIADDCTRKLEKILKVVDIQSYTEKRINFDFKFDQDFVVEIYQKFKNSELETLLYTLSTNEFDEIVEQMKTENSKQIPPNINLLINVNKLGMIEAKAILTYNVTQYMGISINSYGNVEYSLTKNFTEPLNQKQFDDLLESLNITVNKSEPYYNRRSEIGKVKINTIRRELKLNISFTKPIPMTQEQIKESIKKLDEIDKYDQDRIKTMERRNYLESYLFDATEKLENSDFQKYIADNETQEISILIKSTKDWYEDNAYSASLEEIEIKIKNVESKFSVVNTRRDQEKKYINSLEKFEREYSKALKQSEAIRKKKPWIEEHFVRSFTPEMKKLKEFIETESQKQSGISLFEQPILTSEKIENKISKIKKEISILDKIPKPVLDGNKLTMEDLIPRISIEELIKNSGTD